jgi:acetyltransferase
MNKKTVRPSPPKVICPYPAEYETTLRLKDGKSVLLRPIRPEDDQMLAEMFKTFSVETKRFRFFGPIKEVTHEMLARYTRIDYDQELAIIAELAEEGRKKMIGVVRLIVDPPKETAEFAIVVGDPWQGQGLGTGMTRYMLEIAGKRGVTKVFAYVLEDNYVMLHLLGKFKFSTRKEKGMFRLELHLKNPSPAL